MRQSKDNAPKLPQKLLSELGASTDDFDTARKRKNGFASRKAQRKAARVEKKTRRLPVRRGQLPKQQQSSEDVSDGAESEAIVKEERLVKTAGVQSKAPKSILKGSKSPSAPKKQERQRSPSPPRAPVIPRGVRDRLAEDDAEIAALEKALGVKDKKSLPKSFEDDGLDFLLEELEDGDDEDGKSLGKRKRDEGQEWLEKKRQKAWAMRTLSETDGSDDVSDFEGFDSETTSSVEDGGDTEDEEDAETVSSSDEDFDDADNSGEDDDGSSTVAPVKRARENPYVAPQPPSDTVNTTKYIPPSLRVRDAGEMGDLSQLRRQIQGLLNRLSEANILSIVADVERMYQDHPRQYMSTTLLDLLMGLLSDPTTLEDTFIILHAGFIAALYKVIGTDFGAQAIQKIDEDFTKHYGTQVRRDTSGKRLTNLISLLSELYKFQLIGSNLIYDFIRTFLSDLSELNTELLLKIIRNAGSQLRHDDPTSLKDIIVLLQAAIADVGEEKLSVRTKFMIETINNLKNNRMKTGFAASSIMSEHTIRMKKTLGSLNQRSIRATEPLRIGMRDLRDTENRGKWWLVGASYKGPDDHRESDGIGIRLESKSRTKDDGESVIGGAADLAQLARQHRMNTDVRRSIFIAIMSSTDYNDAYLRLMKLRLKKSQELEIPKVLVHCAGAENSYNPFYTLLSRRVCSDRKLKMAFRFSLWDLFKKMGEGDEEYQADGEDDARGTLGLRTIVNLAKMYGTLIAEDGLELGVLKTLNLAYLQSKTRTFVELLLISVIVESQKTSEDQRNEKAIVGVFLKPKEMPEMAAGLRYFLKKEVSKSDIASSKQDRETVRWGCKVATNALKAITPQLHDEL